MNGHRHRRTGAVVKKSRKLAPHVEQAVIKWLPRDLVAQCMSLYLRHRMILIRIRGPRAAPDGKSPRDAGKAPAGSYLDERYWIRFYPKLGPRTGTFVAGLCHPKSGHVVLDVDLRFDGALGGAWSPFPPGWLEELARSTFTVRTAGGGWHIWLRWPHDRPWPKNKDIYVGPAGKIQWKAVGIAVLPPGFVGCDGVPYVYGFWNTSEFALAEVPPELLTWLEEAAETHTDGTQTVSEREAELQQLLDHIHGVRGPRAHKSRASRLVGFTAVPNTGEGEREVLSSGCSLGPLGRFEEQLQPSDGDAEESEVARISQEVLAGAGEDDSSRDFFLALRLIQARATKEQFATVIASWQRRKDAKRVDPGYIDRTWRSAHECRAVEAGLPVLAPEDAERLRVLGHSPLLAGLSGKARTLLLWLIEEACERTCWTIVPGAAKLDAALGLSPGAGGSSRYLGQLCAEGLITVTPRPTTGSARKANVIDLRPLAEVLAAASRRSRSRRVKADATRPEDRGTSR